ncbi:unnamed protein product [Brassica oleracea var. botrytis]
MTLIQKDMVLGKVSPTCGIQRCKEIAHLLKWHGLLLKTLTRSVSESKSNWNLWFPRSRPLTLPSTSHILGRGSREMRASTLRRSVLNIRPTRLSLNCEISSELSTFGRMTRSSSSSACSCEEVP